MHLQEVFNAMHKNHHYEYLIVNKKMRVIEFSDRIIDYCDVKSLKDEKIDLYFIVPELYGLEEQFKELFTFKRKLIEIPKVRKNDKYYVNISVHQGRKNGNSEIETLVVLFENITEYVLIQQRFLQNKNDKELLLLEVEQKNQTLNEFNKNLEDRIKEGVAELRKKDKMLIQQSKMAAMGEMIGIIAHQWKQPLNALSLVVENLQLSFKRGRLDGDFMDKAVKKSRKQILYMSETIDDFRNFFSPKKEKEHFSIKETIENIINILQTQLFKNEITITIRGEDIVLHNYKNEFQQVVMNIVNNSKDALLENKIEDKQIAIVIEKDDINVNISICDNAGGIPENLMDKIFEPYFSTKGDKGTGIGLYMVKMILNDSIHGEIYSENRDKGVCFKISLPFKEKY